MPTADPAAFADGALDMYLPALPAIASDLEASASAVELTLPSFFAGLAVSQLFAGLEARR